jgi:hypothetical protein
MTAKWSIVIIQSILMPGDAPACIIWSDRVWLSAEPRSSCPFFVRYVYSGDLAAEIGGRSCVFTASLHCVTPALPREGKSLFIGTGPATRRH